MNLFPPFYRFRFFSQPSPLLFLVYNILFSKPFICKLAPLLICSWQLSSVMYTKHYITPNLALRWTNTPTTISCAITLLPSSPCRFLNSTGLHYTTNYWIRSLTPQQRLNLECSITPVRLRMPWSKENCSSLSKWTRFGPPIRIGLFSQFCLNV